MKKLLLATTALFVLAVGSASAADVQPAYRPAPPPPPPTWTGLYWGVNVGYSWGEAKRDTTLQIAPGVFGTASRSREVDGVIGGFQTGYNHQFGNWVFGFETDFQASGQKGSEVFQLLAGPPATFLNTEDKLTWFGTSRTRLGVLWSPNVLLYGTVGVAYGQVKEDSTITRGTQSATANFKDTKAGWTAGAGIEGMPGRRLEHQSRVSLHGPRQDRADALDTWAGHTRELESPVHRQHLAYRFQLQVGRLRWGLWRWILSAEEKPSRV